MMSKVALALVLSLLSATTSVVTGKCNICLPGQNMTMSFATIPASTISFIPIESSCFAVELGNVTVLEESDPNCAVVRSSAAPTICGCTSGVETLPDVEVMNNTKAQVNLTLISVASEMDEAAQAMYNEVLTDFYKEYLKGIAINVTAKVVKQALLVPKTRRLQDTTAVLNPLNTTINITGVVDAKSKWMTSGNFSELCANITKNNSASLITSLQEMDLAGNTSYYSGLTKINASKITSSSKPKAKSTKQPELPKGVTAGIMIGIFAVLCLAVYVASFAQGDRLLQRELARQQKEAASKERLARLEAATKKVDDDDIDEA